MKEIIQKKIQPKRALLSVFDKTGIVEFARLLENFNIEIISTGGTARVLQDNGIEVIEIARLTGFPEILGGRVKTLQPQIHGGILARRHFDQDLQDLDDNAIRPIDMVVVNLYPFEQTIARPEATVEIALENIDIGGPCMLRAAAKNFPDVVVICDSDQYEAVANEMKENAGLITFETRARLSVQAFERTHQYDSTIVNYLSSKMLAKDEMPSALAIHLNRIQTLRYGENPHQSAALYAETRLRPGELPFGKQLHGKELSFNNLLDLNSVTGLIDEITECCCVIVKHNNPCGVAVADRPIAAYEKARATDPVSAFGGVVGFNRVVDDSLAEVMRDVFFEVIIAPGFEPGALGILQKKKNLRLLERSVKISTLRDYDLKKITGGYLMQSLDIGDPLEPKLYQVVTKRAPDESEWRALLFGWRVVKWIKSNAVIYTAHDRTLAIGAGQMSRVDSSKLAVIKAEQSGLNLRGSAVASDAFFPFRDGVDAAAEAGATAVIQPGGSIRDDEVILAADEHNMAMVFTGYRHFRH